MKDLLVTMLPPWALIIIFLVGWFLFLTRTAWNTLINEGVLRVKNKFFRFDRGTDQQDGTKNKNSSEYKKLEKLYEDLGVRNIEDLYSTIETNKQSVKDLEDRNNSIFQFWQHYMFSFFDIFLVPRSKLALIWLYGNPYATKEFLCLNIVINSEIENKHLEREAVFNALYSHNLVEKDQRDLYKVSNIGSDYLRFAGLIN